MTISEASLAGGDESEQKIRIRAELRQENPELASTRWAAAQISELFRYIEGESPDFRAYFVVDSSLHEDPRNAEFHVLTHKNFLSELNCDAQQVLESGEDQISVAQIEGFEVVGNIQRHEDGRPYAAWYVARPLSS